MAVGALNNNLVFLCNETMPKSDIYLGKLEITEIFFKRKKKKVEEDAWKIHSKMPFLEVFNIN